MEPTTQPRSRRGRSRQTETAPSDSAGQPREARDETEQTAHLLRALERSKQIQAELRGMVDELTAEPWPIARLLRVLETERGPRALVQLDGSRRLVTLHRDCDPGSLQRGDFVELASERNIVLAALGVGMPAGGELAAFERLTDDGRVVLRARDEERVVDAGAQLDPATLNPGDPVRWDRGCELALERFEPREGESFLLEEVGEEGRELIGGLGVTFQKLYDGLALPLLAPGAAKALGLDEPPLALLHGPPGCGKTLTARALAAELNRKSGRPCRFAVVRPGEFASPYVGETEARIRACFAALRREARHGLVVVFFDELDAIGRIRGGMTSHHADRALGALLAEIDGFEKRGNVAIVAATNRRDVLDAALLSRFCDMDLPIGRPRRDAATAIFEVHLAESLPFAVNGMSAAATRQAAIDVAVSQLYAPNGGGEVCRVGMRDGTTRDVYARELVSGRLIEQITRMAKRSALARHHGGGELGIDVPDVDEAVGRVIGEMSTLLTPSNARAHLDDLPQDADVVRVDTLRPRAARSTRVAHAG